MKKKFKKKEKRLDKTNGFVIHSSTLATKQHSRQKRSLRIKGRERRKKTSQRAISLVRKISVE